MSTLILPDVTIPSFHESPLINEADHDGIIVLGKTLTEKNSTVMKLTRCVVLLASYILPLATSAQKIDLTAIQKSLNGVNAYEAVTGSDSKINRLLKGVSETQKNFSKWQASDITTKELAANFASQGIAVIEKIDGILWAGENFGLGENTLSIGLHAIAYGGTIYNMIKKYIELAQTIEQVKDDPSQKHLLNIKYAKFTLATGAAAFGFLALFIKASAFSVISLIFIGGTAALSLGEYALESHLNPNKEEDESLKRVNTPISIDMTV